MEMGNGVVCEPLASEDVLINHWPICYNLFVVLLGWGAAVELGHEADVVYLRVHFEDFGIIGRTEPLHFGGMLFWL